VHADDSPRPAESSATGGDAPREFLTHYTKTQRRLYLWILSLVPNPTEAEEILQETSLVLWNKFSEFQTGTNFAAWAARVAYFEVMKHRERRRREKLRFSDDLIRLLADEGIRDLDRAAARQEALARCLDRLKPDDRELIRLRYEDGATGESVARRLGRPPNSVSQSLARIRRALYDCVQRQLAAEGQR